MNQQLYNVVFHGELLPGRDPEEVRIQVGTSFNLGAEALDKLFSGRRVLIRKQVDHRTALLLQERFALAGAACDVVEEEQKHVDMQPAGGVEEAPAAARPEAEDAGVAALVHKESAPLPQFRYPLRFSGSSSEYFRIWIVNLLLSLITLGFYAPWAKVRTRRYFYANTLLEGDGFDYLADPKVILKGYLLLLGAFMLYSVAEFFHVGIKIGLAILFAALIPWLIYKSFRFMAHNSAFRNVRFRFLGSLKESYSSYLLFPLLLLPTLGLIFPYLAYRQKKYFFGNMAFGTTVNSFMGTVGPFYRFHAVVLVLIIGIFLAAGLGTGLIAGLGFFLTRAQVQAPSMIMFLGIALAAYLIILLGMTFIKQYLYSRITNYCWSSSSLGSVCFESTLKSRRLFWISMTNILAIILSLGLLFPWAKVRRTRYVLENLTLVSERGLDEFRSTSGKEIGALGDSAMDFFNFEVGL